MSRKRVEVEKSVAGYFRVAKARDEMSAPDIYRGQIEDYWQVQASETRAGVLGHRFLGASRSKPRAAVSIGLG